MATYNRQNSLLANQDWDKVYRAFSDADFSSYDFPTLRRTMINYLRANYPEDFNDYTESSEYLALIDMIAFLGQSLSYRFDLNARENFIELAEQRESVLRLARLVGYNPTRNGTANGFLKILGLQTTENVQDSLGTSLENTFISWNDDTNSNWLEQFNVIFNATLQGVQVIGKPSQSSIIDGITTQQYKINTQNTDVPIYGFSKSVSGRSMNFEVVSSGITDGVVSEETPLPGNLLGVLYRNDKKGNSSPNTGYFMHFRQGQLQSSPFTINDPSPNEIVNIDIPSINNTDVWLWQLDRNNNPTTNWTKLNSIYGSNVIYNSVNKNTRTLYNVVTRTDDQISLNFADGSFGDLPKGNFRVYYRTSNGLTYTIRPNNMQNIVLEIPYINKKGQGHTLTIQLGLETTVTNASVTETTDDIRSNAPQNFYTQNRMITGEDYNSYPLTTSNSVVKVKAVNRVSSGISRQYEIQDPTGKYSTTNLVADDGIIYKNPYENDFSFTFQTRNDILGVIRNTVEPIVDSLPTKAFYYDKFPRISTSDLSIEWSAATNSATSGTGFFKNTLNTAPITVGTFTSNNFKFIVPNSLVKFVPPQGSYFVPNDGTLSSVKTKYTVDYIWTKVVSVIGDGSNEGKGNLDDGSGPIIFSDVIPDRAVPQEIIPNIVTNLSTALETQLVDLIFNYKTFGLRYDQNSLDWKIIVNANLNTKDDFSLEAQGDTTGSKQDKSWFVLFETDGTTYNVTNRGLDYRFESQNLLQFFVDLGTKKYDTETGKVIKDQIKVLKVNEDPVQSAILQKDYQWEIIGGITNSDGYQETNKIRINFYDSDDDGMIDDPDSFIKIVDPASLNSGGYRDKWVYFQQTTTNGTTSTSLLPSTSVVVFDKESNVSSLSGYANGQLFYFYDSREDVIKRYNSTTGTLDLEPNIFARAGRDSIRFQYLHNAENDRRLDPGKSNIIDMYVLTRAYDEDYRIFVNGFGAEPVKPSTEDLKNELDTILQGVKSISDEIIYHSVNYRALFGSNADTSLQATFKIVKSAGSSISDNEIKSAVLIAINDFFALDNWDFGETFYFTELASYVQQQTAPDVANFVIVPNSGAQAFGSLFQIKCKSDEIFISTATVDNIEVIDQITANNLKSEGNVVTSIDNTGSISVSSASGTTTTTTASTGTTTTSSTSSSTQTSSSSSSSSSGSSGGYGY